MSTFGGLILCVFLLFLPWILLKIRKSQRFFQEKDIPCVEPTFFFGSRPSGSVFFRKHISETYDEIYRELSPYKVGGFYELFQPFYMVCDPIYIQQVLATSYSHFQDRGFEVDQYVNPLDGNVAFVSGEKYRYLRNKLNPIFSPIKLRDMFEDMAKCADILVEHFEKSVNFDQETDVYEPLWNHTMNIIATTIMGLELKSFHDPFCKELSKMINIFLEPGFINSIVLFSRFFWPKFLLAFKIPTIDQKISKFFISSIKETLFRRINGLNEKKDIIQHFIELCTKEDENKPASQSDERIELDLNEEVIAAQAFIISIGASASSFGTMYSFIYFIALHPEVQEKIRKEIAAVKFKHGRFTHDSLNEMEYLGCCISETIRLESPVPVIPRICTKSFEFSNGIRIDRGDRLVIPIHSVNRDPKYYPEPLKFIPERFARNSGSTPPVFSFGGGPKMCIGKRFAELEIKIALARLLETFIFEPVSKDIGRTEMNVTLEPKSFLPISKDGLKIIVRQIKH